MKTIIRIPNKMLSVRLFLEKYHQTAKDQPTITFYEHSNGSINSTLDNKSSYQGNSISPNTEYFPDIIEKKIYPIVNFMNKKGYITYSSCEGHVLDDDFSEAHVGILLNDDTNTKKILETFKNNGFLVFNSRLRCMESNKDYQTLEIYFPKAKNEGLEIYHERLDNATCKVVREKN